MLILEKNIHAEKTGDRPRISLPVSWVRDNAKKVYMFKGDEYIILMPKCETEKINLIKEKIKKEL